jgi:hypothetical protein
MEAGKAEFRSSGARDLVSQRNVLFLSTLPGGREKVSCGGDTGVDHLACGRDETPERVIDVLPHRPMQIRDIARERIADRFAKSSLLPAASYRCREQPGQAVDRQ